MRAFALSLSLALVLASGSLAASPAPAEQQKPAKAPSTLWGKYPLGKQKLQPLSEAKTTRTPRAPAPARAPAESPPPVSGTESGGGASVPLWAVLLGALALSCVLGLAGESLVRRAKHLFRPPRGYEISVPAVLPLELPVERADDAPPPLPPSIPKPDRAGGSLSASVHRLREAAAALGYEDPKLQAVVEAVTVSGEWRPLAIATVLSSWEDQTATVQLARPRGRLSQPEGGMIMGDGYADLGNRVAAVIHAAEEVAARVREEAREEAAAIRRDAETAASVRVEHLTKEAEQLHQKAEKVLAEAEAQARARHEAAEATAARIEAEAIKHQEDLNAAARALEERLQNTLEGLERVSTNAEEVLGPAAKPKSARKKDGTSSSEALSA
jgi:hypothetical protein